MATNTTTPFVTVAAAWPFLQPAMTNPKAHMKQIKLPASVSYPKGQVLGPVTASPGVYKAPGAGVGNPCIVTPYQYTTDAAGLVSLGGTANANDVRFESVPGYFLGPFFLRDLTGVADQAMLDLLGKVIQGNGFGDTLTIVLLG